MMPPKPKARSRHSAAVLIIGGWILLGGLLTYNRQGISDWWSLRTYHPSAAVTSIATADTLTGKARDIFYVNQPDITAKQTFADNCPSGTERTVVLGCYHSNQAGIYILQVSDTRLQGVEQVTAAHEMLHAAYDRLSSSQKRQINTMLTDYYQHGLQDATVKQQIDDYKQSEPADVTNEMHSLFATEIQQLPTDLEHYYSRYFSNRAAVVTQYNQYETEFSSRQATIKSDDEQLRIMKQQITTAEDSLGRQSSALDAQRSRLDSERSSGQVAAYNAAVPAYNAAVDSYNAQAADLRSLIARYNALVQSRNTVAAETNQLTAEISNTVPAAQ